VSGIFLFFYFLGNETVFKLWTGFEGMLKDPKKSNRKEITFVEVIPRSSMHKHQSHGEA